MRGRRMRRLLLLGGMGQLGHVLAPLLLPLGELIVPARSDLDLADGTGLRAAVQALRPDVIVNAAAYTAVDAAEADADRADRINHLAPRILAEEQARHGGLLVHYSTDYVFPGLPGSGAGGSLREDDPTGPLNVYGRSKLAGELAVRAVLPAHLIFRTSWLYGPHGGNFISTMRGLMQSRETLQVVADQWGAPTPAGLVAEVTALALQRCLSGPKAALASLAPPVPSVPFGLYHLQCAGATTWHGYAEFLLAAWRAQNVPGLRCERVLPVTSADFARPAARPPNGRLDCALLEKTFGLAMPEWRRPLAMYLEEGQVQA